MGLARATSQRAQKAGMYAAGATRLALSSMTIMKRKVRFREHARVGDAIQVTVEQAGKCLHCNHWQSSGIHEGKLMGMCFQRKSHYYKISTYPSDSCPQHEGRSVKMCLTCRHWERGKLITNPEWRYGRCQCVYSSEHQRECTAGRTACAQWSRA